jgi:GNAT superfamily N-acetyltransferase
MNMVEYRCGEYLVSTDRALIDIEVVFEVLTNSYWANGIPRGVIVRSIENALCFGIYKGREQVGFARVISDFATYAYIGDVFIVESHQGRGLGKFLMESILKHPQLQGLRRWSLVTRDAHGLYEKFGFEALKAPENYMEILNPDVYKRSR